MTEIATSATSPDLDKPVVVTGANGFVGSYVCHALIERGASVRAVVRREGTAPDLEGLTEFVGDFTDAEVATQACAGAGVVVHTVHPMGEEDGAQQQSVQWSAQLAEAAREADVPLFVHVSTTSVYERKQDTGDVDEFSALSPDDDNEYAVTKRDTDLALAEVDGLTRVLVRPTAILGPGESSIWNTLRPKDIRDNEDARTEDPERTFGWLHVRDLADLIADLATGRIPTATDSMDGPVAGAATPVNAVSGNRRLREYIGPVCAAVGVEPIWTEPRGFRADLVAERARSWGWTPKVTFEEAIDELLAGLTDLT
ncbi:MAG: NAD(P)-dependent oxidoreductase [Actinomycetia bacterium]|nr:NAD(P)-dependent oxidoreductase [Actinomycetes bacterium]